jgi:transcriptional regulator with XRE-family HTH domain
MWDMLPFKEKVGRAIRRLREERNVSQEAFADRVGLHRTAMSALERGRTDPRLSTLERVARGLGVRVSELLHDAEHGA